MDFGKTFGQVLLLSQEALLSFSRYIIYVPGEGEGRGGGGDRWMSFSIVISELQLMSEMILDSLENIRSRKEKSWTKSPF